MSLRALIASFVGLTALVLAAANPLGSPVDSAPLARRSEIASDEIVGFAETVPDTTIGQLYLKYKPYLKVFNGCVPFPAVDAEGNTNAGLAPTGASDGDCSSNTGQVYCRSATYEDYFAIMYSWYMPKDEPSDGIGHRHDWENIVLWLSDDTLDATIEGIAFSQHGGYVTTTSPDLDGDNPTVGYISYWPLDHCLIETTDVGGMQPLIAWESLPTVAQEALDDTDFGDAIVAFKDSDFTSYLESAYEDTF